jgi:hypothetical protein
VRIVDRGKEREMTDDRQTRETELVLIGGEKLRVKGAVDEISWAVSKEFERGAGFIVFEVVGTGERVHVAVGAVGYLRAGLPQGG